MLYTLNDCIKSPGTFDFNLKAIKKTSGSLKSLLLRNNVISMQAWLAQQFPQLILAFVNTFFYFILDNFLNIWNAVKKKKHTFLVGKYKIYLYSLRNWRVMLGKFRISTFLELVQINFIFADKERILSKYMYLLNKYCLNE